MTRIVSTAVVLAAALLLLPGLADDGSARADDGTPVAETGASTSEDGRSADDDETSASASDDESTEKDETDEQTGTTEQAGTTGPQAVPSPATLAPVRPVAGPRLPDTRLRKEAEPAEGEAAAPRTEAARTGSRTRVAACGEPPAPAGAHTFRAGESLVFDVDIMGVRAGNLTLSVAPASGGGIAFTAAAKTNNFFANVREVDGRATSYTRDGSLHPARYREDATEDGVRKWAEVLFPSGREEVDVRFGVGERERRVRYTTTDTPHDLISVVYYLRTLDLSVGQDFCLDVYGNRRMWRISGTVADEEFVNTPAGGFETWRLSGSAQRMDLPSFERELHVWIAQDEHRTPVAAMSAIDLGPVRARLSRLGGQAGERRRPDYGGGRW